MPVTFWGDVALIMAMHCNMCHGDAGGLSTRTYADVMKGGDLGKVIVAGNAEQSLFVHFIDGRRGRTSAMPRGGEKLSQEQIDTIRRWIDEGAQEGQPPEPATKLTAQPKRKPISVTCDAQRNAYVTLELRQSSSNKLLFDRADAAPHKPKSITWSIFPEPAWKKDLTLEVRSFYAASKCKWENK